MLKKYVTRHIKILLFLLSGLIVSFFYVLSLKHQRVDKHNILVIHSYKESNDWVKDMNRGIQACFVNNRLSVEIENVYLKEKKEEIYSNIDTVRSLLDSDAARDYDLIICCETGALFSLLETGHSLSYQIPVVFTSVDYIPDELLDGHTNITGFTTTPDYEKCYQLARQIFGRIDEMILIAEDSPLGKMAITEARNQFKAFPNITYLYESFWNYSESDTIYSEMSVVNPLQVRIERIDMMYGERLKEVLYYKLHSVCVLPQWASNYALLPRMGTAPFMMVNSRGFGDGQIGGYMTPPYDKAYDATLVGIDLIKGTKAADIPIRATVQLPVFDWDQLQFWRIDQSRLPDDSLIPNMPFMVKYKDLLISVAIIAAMLIILFGLMITRLYKREAYTKRVAQKRLEKEQQELNITINSLKEGVVSVDTNGTILSINTAAIEILDLDPDDTYLGVSVWSLFDIQEKGNVSYLKDLIRNLSDSFGNYRLSDTAYLITYKKKIFNVSGNVSSLFYDGCSYGSVITFHDITDEFTRKEYLALSMISGDIFAWHYDQYQKVLVYEPSYFEELQIQDDGTHSISADEFLKTIHPDDMDGWMEATGAVYKGEKKKTTKQLRIKIPGSDDYEWWEYRFSTVSGSVKESSFKLLGICMNVEQFKRTEAELIRLRDEAEKSDQMKGVFLANMSHEVRTPLNAIVGFSSLLIDSEQLTVEARTEFIDIINENCRLLLNLINEILDISRIESGIVFRKEPCQLTILMQELASQIQKEQQRTEVELVLDLPETPYTILSDSYRLKQILGNLLDNAYKFTKVGSITMGYELNAEEGEVILFVSDTGVGIAPEELAKIFERFYKSDDFVQGGGLGLPIVQEIVKRMSGFVEVESVPDKGTCFKIHLLCEE